LIEAICARHGVSLLAAALQYVTRHPAVTTTIPGGKTPAEATANVVAAREVIPDAVWHELEPHITTWEVVAR
jgi:D-threo-aldose 1-dehydrogenase